MLRVISKMVTTLQKDEISFGSLETKYHAPDKATIASVRDMLFKWINILGKLWLILYLYAQLFSILLIQLFKSTICNQSSKKKYGN